VPSRVSICLRAVFTDAIGEGFGQDSSINIETAGPEGNEPNAPLFYNAEVKSWDVIVIGGGIIGLSLSIALRKRGASVLVVERGEPGREASYAAGGMLVDSGAETLPELQPLATASARMYPEFAHELQIESGVDVDLRERGTIVFPAEPINEQSGFVPGSRLPAPLAEFEPALAKTDRPAFFLKERCVDPRALTTAAWQTARERGVDFSSGDSVQSVVISRGRVTGVTTTKTAFAAPKVVNCAGAWAGEIAPHPFPTRPKKGQMLCLAAPSRNLLTHVIRTPEIYLIPRSDGRILVGTTVEDAGFDKRTDPATIQRFHRSAVALVPELQHARILEDWAGLRPGTPDALPILGATSIPGYYVAAGHFRDGILLAPITAQIMTDVINDTQPGLELAPFSPRRFATISSVQ
jgi:glycine oxidase